MSNKDEEMLSKGKTHSIVAAYTAAGREIERAEKILAMKAENGTYEGDGPRVIRYELERPEARPN
jgi:hypothetical protein